MRNRYFGTYQSIVYKKCYWEAHLNRSEKRLFIAKLLCATVSIASVLAWSISESMPILWACLIAAAQLAQAMVGYLPWSAQVNALHYLLPDLKLLIVDVDIDWMRLGYVADDEDDVLMEKAAQYERRYYEIEDQFTSGVWFPELKSVVTAAERARDNYFRVRYFLPEGDDDNEQPNVFETSGTTAG